MRRVIVVTGNGKGKTTSALGCAMRALGRGFKVRFYQFIKSKDVDYGEHLFLKGIVRLGYGCRKDFKYDDKDKKAAVDGLKRIKADLSKVKGPKTVFILDEVSYPVNWKWFTATELTRMIKKHKNVNFILTGRDMPKSIIAVADTVSEVKELKHAYQKGCKAQQGIEF